MPDNKIYHELMALNRRFTRVSWKIKTENYRFRIADAVKINKDNNFNEAEGRTWGSGIRAQLRFNEK